MDTRSSFTDTRILDVGQVRLCSGVLEDGIVNTISAAAVTLVRRFKRNDRQARRQPREASGS